MILTGSIVPDISVLAAQPAVEDTAENNDADVQVDEASSVENTDAVQNPDAGDDDSTNGVADDDDVEEVSDEVIAVLATSDVSYTNQSVTFNYYVGELDASETVGFYKWGTSINVDENKNPKLSWGGWGNASTNPVYRMNAVDGHTGWYNITLTVSETLTIDSDTGISTKSLGGFSVFKSSSTGAQEIECSGYDGKHPEIY